MRTRILVAGMVGALLLLGLAACGKSNNSSTTGAAPATSTTNSTAGGSSASGAVPVNAATKKKVGKVLVNSKGLTLYHITTDKNGKITCTAGCAKVWPPLLVPSGAKVTAGSGATGTLATVKRPDGATQATYNGVPLYTYAKDSDAEDVYGQGVDGVWFAVKAGSKPASTGGASSGSSGGSSSGY